MSFEEQIMSKDKYLSIFSRQVGAIVFIVLEFFLRNTRSFKNWEISLVPKGIFSHVTLLDQSRASENI